MIDNVLQSFCERCGKRFTQPAPPERPTPSPPGVLGRFRRHADSGVSDLELSSSSISQAFEHMFHFCLECRRYNCAECWNPAEGHCLSCRPAGEQPTVPAHTTPRVSLPATTPVAGRSVPNAAHEWPVDDVGPTPLAAPRAGDTTRGSLTERRAHEPDAPTSGHAPASSGSASETRAEASVGAVSGAEEVVWGPPAEELDPWRGVVFSAEEVADPSRQAAPARTAHEASRSTRSEIALPWPALDQPVPAHPPLPATADEDVGVLASLIEPEPHVDPAGWARASSAVVGRGSLKPPGAVEEVKPPSTEPAAPEEAEAVEETIAPVEVAAPVPAVDVAAPVAEVSVPAVDVAAPVVEVSVPSSESIPSEPLPSGEEATAVQGVARTEQDATVHDVLPAAAATAEDVDTSEAKTSLQALDAPEAAPAADDAVTPEPNALQEAMPAASPAATPEDAGVQVDTAARADRAEVKPPAPQAPGAPDPLGPLTPPRQSLPLGPLPGLEVWAIPAEQGPFAQPYQPSPAQATVYPPGAASARPQAGPAQVFPPPAVPGPVTPAPTVTPPTVAPPSPPVGQPAAMPPPVPRGPMPPTASPAVSAPAWQPASIQPPSALAPSAVPPASPTSMAPAPSPQGPLPPRPAAPVGRQGIAGSHACPNCALPLSTKARFCRRCGAPQTG